MTRRSSRGLRAHTSVLGLAVLVTTATGAGLLTSGPGSAADALVTRPAVTVPAAPAPMTQRLASAATAEDRIAHLLPSRLSSLRLGSRASVLVHDVDTGSEVVAVRASTARLPASLSKIATAMTALATLGPAHRFETVAVLAPDGALALRGGGDATLTSADLATLARGVATALGPLARAPRPLLVDDTVFPAPTLAPGWPSSYYRGSVSPVRGLSIDRDSSADTGMLAGRRFAVALERAGVEVGRVSRRRTPAGGTTLAVLQGQRLDQQVMTMLQFSDNDMAENLARHVAIAEGLRPDWAGATAARAQVLQRLGIPTTGLRLLDGSGLSRASRASAQSLVAMLALAAAPTRPEFASVAVGGLPTAGRTGSLRPARGRFVTAPSKCAAGNLWAKTGLLRDVVGLAGYTRSTDGHLQAFAIVVNGAESSLTLRRRVDSLAATITGCW